MIFITLAARGFMTAGEKMTKTENPVRPVLVTGSSSGIGAAICAVLHDRGVPVIGVDRNPRSSTHWDAITADLTDPAAVLSILDALPDKLAGLVNAAGVPGTYQARNVLAVNFLALKEISTAVAPRLDRGGFIVNICSSVAEDWSDRADMLCAAIQENDLDSVMEQFAGEIAEGAYRFSKECVRAWTQFQAAHLLPQGVRVNSVSPGPVDTPILNDFKADHGVEKVESAALVTNGFGKPEDIAHVVSFLASPASVWINGTDVVVDGGLQAARNVGPMGEVSRKG
ncbi:SDR family oxidoreductase [Citricoccus sp. NR2]|uniref:SDR family oxidoreductase n=1 Tax=Citricoccus sp. NR2 TaxID=3004095 RepID=UPI0022DCFC4A|nr:SDR family oxidoreductase [Citricoccus sp. NR2]WBL19753.1 SDR family oxidoreductase [Citricoccus sp. NR2]